jgi:hypothetical protein
VELVPGKGTFITYPVPTVIYVLDGKLTEEREEGATQTYERRAAGFSSRCKTRTGMPGFHELGLLRKKITGGMAGLV